MTYCTLVRAGSVRTSVPSPGKQSAVDQTRAPAAVSTVNTCSGPERSRVQGTEPVFFTDSPSTGRSPTANDGAPVVAVSCNTASEHSGRPWASVVGAGGAVGFCVTLGFALGVAVVGVGFALLGLALVGVTPLGAAVVGAPVVGAAVVGGPAFGAAVDGAGPVVVAACFAPVVVGFPPGGVGMAGAVVAGTRPAVAGIDPPEVEAPPDDGDKAAEVEATVAAADPPAAADDTPVEAAAELAGVNREASTPVNVGAADPLIGTALLALLGVPPLDRPATTKITPTNTAISTTMKVTRRIQ